MRVDDKPECELIAGTSVAKPSGALEHRRIERRLVELLEPFEQRGRGQVVWELSVRHGDEVRIPDVVFVSTRARFEDGILVDPPLLCVEILSPSQRESELFAKCAIYHAWGVPYCWVVDPKGKRAWESDRHSPIELVSAGVLRAGELAVAIEDLFCNT